MGSFNNDVVKVSKFFTDASIANFEQVFISWCFSMSFTVIKKLNL